VDDLKERKLQSEGLIRINVNELIEKTDLSCTDEGDVARQVYIRVVDLAFEEDRPENDIGLKKLPEPATPADLCNFYVMPSRHQAYSTFWMYASGLNVVGNIFVWFYF
jgi:hypothetical protein